MTNLLQTQTTPRDWALFELVIFDCDSTLTAIEGVDEMAHLAGCEAEVAALTAMAMEGALPLEAVYARRLHLLQPTRDHLRRLRWLYRENIVPDAVEVIAALQALGRKVCIVSGGVAEAVQDFGQFLGVRAEDIYAVELEFNQLSGRWWEYWNHTSGLNPDERYLAHTSGPLTVGKGKAAIIRALRLKHRGRALMVGDGASDLEASEAVELFCGFGGVTVRERIAAEADAFITVCSLAPVLPLTLGRANVPPPFEVTYELGVQLIREGGVRFRASSQRQALLQSLS